MNLISEIYYYVRGVYLYYTLKILQLYNYL